MLKSVLPNIPPTIPQTLQTVIVEARDKKDERVSMRDSKRDHGFA